MADWWVCSSTWSWTSSVSGVTDAHLPQSGPTRSCHPLSCSRTTHGPFRANLWQGAKALRIISSQDVSLDQTWIHEVNPHCVLKSSWRSERILKGLPWLEKDKEKNKGDNVQGQLWTRICHWLAGNPKAVCLASVSVCFSLNTKNTFLISLLWKTQ